MRRIYRRRQACLFEGLSAISLRARPADGGLHLVVDLPVGVDDRELWARLRGRGVMSVPISVFRLRPAPEPESALLLGYAGFEEREL